ncbi:unnamed protein product [Prorocentrum cordatum]|uniref:Uncharacterized protein n=1 Tax=Prorocentrum cordatum TaxID=2364126 RepID=A0ABN9WPE0_9DINO|nr:unnamed protein product [Polarella glacialis]
MRPGSSLNKLLSRLLTVTSRTLRSTSSGRPPTASQTSADRFTDLEDLLAHAQAAATTDAVGKLDPAAVAGCGPAMLHVEVPEVLTHSTDRAEPGPPREGAWKAYELDLRRRCQQGCEILRAGHCKGCGHQLRQLRGGEAPSEVVCCLCDDLHPPDDGGIFRCCSCQWECGVACMAAELDGDLTDEFDSDSCSP